MDAIEDLLKIASEKRASDVHLTVGLPPQIRIDGILHPLDAPALNNESVKQLAYQMLSPHQIERFDEDKELDTSYSIPGFSRFRVNLYQQRGSVAAAIRMIPFDVPSMEELGLPKMLEAFCNKPHGLFIVSGPTGSGKSTTLASMIRYINERRNCHIITIEDPIEYLHRHKKATINQRELGVDTHSFQGALKHILREDPDVIMLGEMRDADTMAAALTLAETGHLVFSTLHTSDVMHAIQRIVDVFSPYQQSQIRLQLSLVTLGIMVQQLLPHTSGKGRAVACEMMPFTASVGNLIRENQLHQLRSVLQTGSQQGMCSMNQSMVNLFKAGQVAWEEIERRSTDPAELATLVKQH